MPWSRAHVGPSPGVQGELKELLRKLGRFSCYQGNRFGVSETYGSILYRPYLGPGHFSLLPYLGPGHFSLLSILAQDSSVCRLKCPGPELLL